MGIVVSIVMLLGLIILRPSPWGGGFTEKQGLRLVTFASASLVTMGLWNVFWYGARHLGEFWGWAAIVSGLTMIMAAVIIFKERSDSAGCRGSWSGAIRGTVVLVLAACFLLYSVTIVQLNMGLPILGR